MPRSGSVSLCDRRLRHEFVFGLRICKELERSGTVEVPSKWARLSIAQLFVQPQSLFNFL